MALLVLHHFSISIFISVSTTASKKPSIFNHVEPFFSIWQMVGILFAFCHVARFFLFLWVCFLNRQVTTRSRFFALELAYPFRWGPTSHARSHICIYVYNMYTLYNICVSQTRIIHYKHIRINIYIYIHISSISRSFETYEVICWYTAG